MLAAEKSSLSTLKTVYHTAAVIASKNSSAAGLAAALGAIGRC